MQMVTALQTSPAEAARSLAASFKPFALACDNLILSGGATAESILEVLGVSVLTLQGELLPGIPLSMGAAWRIVTKSGGFGKPDALNQLMGHK
ncbi:MAG: nucleotide-binding domain containing protein [Thiolinea sp.]